LKLERAYQQGVGIPARGLLLEGGSGVAMLGLPLGHLLYQCYPFLQAIIVHLMYTLIMASHFTSELCFVLLSQLEYAIHGKQTILCCFI